MGSRATMSHLQEHDNENIVRNLKGHDDSTKIKV